MISPRAVTLLIAVSILPSVELLAQGADPAAEPEVAIEQIATAWKRRQQKVHSGRFHWREIRFMARSRKELQASPFDPPAGDADARSAEEQDTIRHEYECRLTFRGDQIRFISGEPMLFAPTGEFIPRGLDKAFNGRELKSLRSLDESLCNRFFPSQGDIQRLGGDDVRGLLPLTPMLLHFEARAEYPDGFVVVPHGALLDAKPMVVLQRVKRTTGPLLESLWLDVGQEYAVRRITLTLGSRPFLQCDISYAMDAVYGPIPTGWKSTQHRNGRFDRSVAAAVLAAEVNPELPADNFDLTFPVGTLVSDSTATDAQDGARYIVRPGGKKRIILPGEARRATPEELLRTEAGMAGVGHGAAQQWSALAVACLSAGALLLLVLFLVWWRRAG